MKLSPLESWALLLTLCTAAALAAVWLARRLEAGPGARRPPDVDLVGPPRLHPDEGVRLLPPETPLFDFDAE